MNSFKFALTAIKHDWYSGALRLIGISVSIAIACLTSVNFFIDRVNRATEQWTTELLAADLVLHLPQSAVEKFINKAIDDGLQYSLNESFRSVVISQDKFVLSEVKSVDENYPLRGKLRIADQLFDLEYETDTIPEKGTVWLENRLMQNLQIRPHDRVKLGASEFIVDKILTYEPDRGGSMFNIAPRLLMNHADLEKTGLILPGSHVEYTLLISGNPDQVKNFRDQIEVDHSENIRIKGIKDTNSEVRTALKETGQFLAFAALVSIALSGLAIAMAAQYYANRHYDNCAILRCLGLQQRQIVQIYLYQLLILSLIAGATGCLIGYVAQEVLNTIMKGMMHYSLPPPSLRPVLSGLAASLIMTMAFALPQLSHLRHVSPLRVLRRDLHPLPLNTYLVHAIAILALIVLSPWQSGNTKLTLYTLTGLFLTALVFAITSRLFIHLLEYLRPKLKTSARYALASIIRHSNKSLIQMIGISTGITVMLLLTLIRTDLLTTWENRFPEETPNYFLINILPKQVNEVRLYLADSLNKNVRFYPMIRGRLTKINDSAINIENYKESRARHLASREFNLSYAEQIQEDNQLISGEWWSRKHKAGNYFSIETGIAETLGIKQGDTLTYLIAGQELTGEVINLRQVEWDSFHVNFFVIANPEALISYPATFISSFHIVKKQRQLLIDLVKKFPGITIVDIDAILSQVRAITNQIAHAVEFIFIFSILTGITILFAALQSTHDERMHESALMSALGASRKKILSGLIAEFLCTGIMTGLLTAFAASCIQIVLAEFVFNIDINISPLLWILAPIICSLIIVLTGLYGTRQVLFSSPMNLLRRV